MSSNGGDVDRPVSKETPLAFLPTPNDSLFSVVRFATGSSSISSSSIGGKSRSMSQSHEQNFTTYRERSESAIFSPSQTSNMSSLPQTPHDGGSYVAPAQREQVPSASLLPNTSSYTDGPDPTDDTFWYNLHLETLENFDRERATWKKMTDRLRQDIDKLKAELAAAHSTPRDSPSRQDSAYHSTDGKESDKIFFNQDTVSRATQKLREFSVVSPLGRSLSPTNGTLDPATLSHVRKSSFSSRRLPSIHESASRKRVSIAEPSRSHESVPVGDVSAIPGENPMSPPPTAYPQSPPPPSYIADAGHTPTRGSARTSFISDQKTRSIRNNSIAWGFDNDFYHRRHHNVNPDEVVQEEEGEDNDGDEELRSPKFLPTTPKPGENEEFMSALDGKLEAIAAHPEDNEPEVLKLVPVVTREGDDDGCFDPAAAVISNVKAVDEKEKRQQGDVAAGPATGGKKEEEEKKKKKAGDEEDEDGEEAEMPIRFNRKRSLNFGAQMGSL